MGKKLTGVVLGTAFALLFLTSLLRASEHGGTPMEHGGKEMKESSVTVTGEVIDTFCFASMGAKGESHRACGLDCAKKGIPVGIVEDKTNKVFVLLPPKDKNPIPEAAVQKMGRKATITGKTYTSGGTQFLTVESVK